MQLLNVIRQTELVWPHTGLVMTITFEIIASVATIY
jgi:hypothetical protein